MNKDTQQALFFIVVSPGFESVALYELTRYLRTQLNESFKYEIFSGGIEVQLPLGLGLSLNRYLRIPTRILMRIATSEILSFPDLQKMIRRLELQKYAPLGKVYVSSRSSKLKIKNEIKECFEKTLSIKEESVGTDVYVRFFRDECTISIDTSGEDLFMRGKEKWVGEAPIRDTMAAALLQFSLQGIDDVSVWQAVDPMMGSGTFLVEACEFGEPLKRSFSFEKWYKQSTTNVYPRSSFKDVVGSDFLDKNVDIAKKNLAHFKDVKINLSQKDLFRNDKMKGDKRRLVIVNPPYGKRLKIKKENFFQSIFDSIVSKYDPERIGLLLPRGQKVQANSGYEQVRYLEFSNNSIDVHFHLYLKSKN